MTVKLKIDLVNGVLEAEGDDAFVKSIHSEFRSYVGDFFKPSHTKHRTSAASVERVEDTGEDAPEVSERSAGGERRRGVSRKRRSGSSEAGRKVTYEPKVDPDLKLPGLTEIAQQYDLKTHKDKILFFGHYLQNVAGKSPFSANQIFTCYKITKDRPPQAFAKALNDARSVYHFFKYETLDEISVTHLGDTYFDHDLKKKG
jgi:hypothetical protein